MQLAKHLLNRTARTLALALPARIPDLFSGLDVLADQAGTVGKPVDVVTHPDHPTVMVFHDFVLPDIPGLSIADVDQLAADPVA